MVNYNNSKLYTIRSHSCPDLIYVGSTTQRLSKRMYEHTKGYQHWKAGTYRTYTSSFKVIECGDAYIELLRAVSCSSREELQKLEGEAIRSMQCVNIRLKIDEEERKVRTKLKRDKYNNNNREKVRERNRQYRKDNKEKIQAYEKLKIECECGAVVSQNNRWKHKQSKKHKQWQQLHDFIHS